MNEIIIRASEVLSFLNILIIPGVLWIIKVEKRLVSLETKFDMCFDIKPEKKGE